MTNPIAQIFADTLGLTPETAGWAFCRNIFCMKCDAYVGHASSPYCKTCRAVGYVEERSYLTATSPLAEHPTPGWLEAFVGHAMFRGLDPCPNGFTACWATDKWTDVQICVNRETDNPVHACAHALMAANPTLAQRVANAQKEIK